METIVRDCIFCRIVAERATAAIVHESAAVVCFLPREAEVYGHTLVATRAHYDDLYDLPTPLLGELMAAIQHLSRVYRERSGATGVNLLHASGRDAQQSVLHFHIHLLPRFPGDGVDAWPALAKVRFDRQEFLARLRPRRPGGDAVYFAPGRGRQVGIKARPMGSSQAAGPEPATPPRCSRPPAAVAPIARRHESSLEAEG
jgi:histidine triad (HIT) family protein